MKLLIQAILVLALGALVSSCASISKEECSVGDWNSIGERDASQGKKKSVFYKYVKDCNEHGVSPDKKTYTEGYKTGLKSYCTSEKGFEVGKSGSRNPNICPKGLSSNFNSAYEKGKKIYGVSSQVTSKEREIEKIEKEIDSIQDNMVKGVGSRSQIALSAMKMDKLRTKQTTLRKEKEELEKKLSKMNSMGL